MEDTLVAPATPTAEPVTPTDVTPTEPTAEPSIAEHEAQFGRNKPEPTEPVAEKSRHRAQSQKATPADAPRIAELTKKWRDAERERDEWKAKASIRPEPVAASPAPIPAATPSPVPAAEKPAGKPTMKSFEDQVGTKYGDYAEAIEAFYEARDEWRDAQGKQVQQRQQQEQSHQATLDTYVTRAREFATQTPDFFDKTASVAADFDSAPQLLQAAVIQADNGPHLAYYLATHPAVLDDEADRAEGKPITPTSVARLQRRLSNYLSQAANTGSAPVVTPRQPAPRPPNPVRTSAMTPADDAPGDDASIAEHERFYGRKRR